MNEIKEINARHRFCVKNDLLVYHTGSLAEFIDAAVQAMKDRKFLLKRIKELEKGKALACQLYGHTNFDVEYDGTTFLRCSVCGENKDDQNE
jgi:hypothetical protein